MELPIAEADNRERADAARNRAAIVEAAARLFAQRGVACTSMDVIAKEAGVGKGTLFRRFGDRASLARAVLDADERAFQDAVVSGPPPLGPGAPACDRLVAFGETTFDRLALHTDIFLAAETDGAVGAHMRTPPYAVRWLHVKRLLETAAPDVDADYTADILLVALSAREFKHMRDARGMELERIKAAWAAMVLRLTAPPA